MGANFIPDLDNYSGQGAFRFWCQKVLPAIYDDSLSYYELLCKVVGVINEAIGDIDTCEKNIGKLLNSYESLQEYVNNYFENLNVQEEVNNKLNEMAESGELEELISVAVAEQVVETVTEQIDGVVEEQIGGVVEQQIGGVVEEQLPFVVAEQIEPIVTQEIDASVSEHIGDAVGEQIGETVEQQLPGAISQDVPGAVEDWLDENDYVSLDDWGRDYEWDDTSREINGQKVYALCYYGHDY